MVGRVEWADPAFLHHVLEHGGFLLLAQSPHHRHAVLEEEHVARAAGIGAGRERHVEHVPLPRQRLPVSHGGACALRVSAGHAQARQLVERAGGGAIGLHQPLLQRLAVQLLRRTVDDDAPAHDPIPAAAVRIHPERGLQRQLRERQRGGRCAAVYTVRIRGRRVHDGRKRRALELLHRRLHRRQHRGGPRCRHGCAPAPVAVYLAVVHASLEGHGVQQVRVRMRLRQGGGSRGGVQALRGEGHVGPA
mmetsp:Transcript_19634/g.48593  ORF Transcript_19634/g.48593 Transcript_19634/m.48593 type:complete len:248 (-) Transcript_19634:61-804(-)